MREERVSYDCASFYYPQEGSFCNLCMKFMSFPGKRRGLTGEGGGGHVGGADRQRFPFLVGVWRGVERGRYPAHLIKALEPAVLGCVKSGNLAPLMYNLELTANKVGFCLYALVLSVCLSDLLARPAGKGGDMWTPPPPPPPVTPSNQRPFSWGL